jgi:aminoglycoside phosphotransferase (APT) family kinase protein
MNGTVNPTAVDLLTTLRQETGVAGLDYARPPTALTGGYYAEMARFTLADPPASLAGELVARIVPNETSGEWEATIQRAVADQGFPTPAIRLTAPASSPLGRYLIVMDHVDGAPPLGGLGVGNIVGQFPSLLRRLPDQLATMATQLHALDAGPLAATLEALDAPMATTAGFIEHQTLLALLYERDDLVAAGKRLLYSEPACDRPVITHGDLHPFNLLVTADGPVLIDWTVARVAHPAFTVAFTELMLANPPIPLPRVGAAAFRPVARNLARRFLASYRRQASPVARVDDDQLDWHRKVHALRILVELAGWDTAGARPASHPWLVIEPVATRLLLEDDGG